MKKISFLIAMLMIAGCEGSGSSGGGGNPNPNLNGNNNGGNNNPINNGGNNNPINNGGNNNPINNGGNNNPINNDGNNNTNALVGRWSQATLPQGIESSVLTLEQQSITWAIRCQGVNGTVSATAPATYNETHITVLESRQAGDNSCAVSIPQGMYSYRSDGRTLELDTGDASLTFNRN